nr:potassium-transporting ATPase subunit F [Pseudoclavibacter alba]
MRASRSCQERTYGRSAEITLDALVQLPAPRKVCVGHVSSPQGERRARSSVRGTHGRLFQPCRASRTGGRPTVTAEHIIALILGVSALAYLLAALIDPERFS